MAIELRAAETSAVKLEKSKRGKVMGLRHEWKYEISCADRLALQGRLALLMGQDSHAIDGRYEIRSLYFDNLQDKALLEKIDGVNCREKFRLRYYNGDLSFLLLEKKSKRNGLCEKRQIRLTMEEAQAASAGDFVALRDTQKPLLRELCEKMRHQGLRPKTLVDYTRRPFVYAPGNVRVTLDDDIRTGMACIDFLNPRCITVPAGGGTTILEVKWDSFLPAVIQDLLQMSRMPAVAVSKYALCRLYD